MHALVCKLEGRGLDAVRSVAFLRDSVFEMSEELTDAHELFRCFETVFPARHVLIDEQEHGQFAPGTQKLTLHVCECLLVNLKGSLCLMSL